MNNEKKTPIGEEIIRNNPTGHGLFAGIGDNFNSVAQVICELADDAISNLRANSNDPDLSMTVVLSFEDLGDAFAYTFQNGVLTIRADFAEQISGLMIDDPDQSVGVEVRRVEYRLGLVAIAPLAVCKCVDGKVNEGILLHAVPLQLPRRRHHAHRRRRLGGAAPQHKHRRHGRKGNPFHVHHRSGLGLGLNLCFRLSVLLPLRRAARTVVRASFDPRSPTPPAIGPRRKKYDFCRRFSSCVRAT